MLSNFTEGNIDAVVEIEGTAIEVLAIGEIAEIDGAVTKG